MTKAIYGVKAEYFKALAHGVRIRILELLSDGERSAGDLVSDLELEQSNVSQQLAVLRERGILETRREGATVYYRVKDPRTMALLSLAKEILMTSLTESQDLLVDLGELQFEREVAAGRTSRRSPARRGGGGQTSTAKAKRRGGAVAS